MFGGGQIALSPLNCELQWLIRWCCEQKVVPLKLVSLELFEKKEVVWRNFFIRLSAHKRIQLSRHLRNSLVHSFQSINHYTISSYLKTMPVTNFFKHINKVYTTYFLNFTPFIIKIYGSSKCNLVNSEMAKSEIHLGSQNGQNYNSAVYDIIFKFFIANW